MRFGIYINHRETAKSGYLYNWAGRDPTVTQDAGKAIICKSEDQAKSILGILEATKGVQLNTSVPSIGYSAYYCSIS